MKRIVAYVADDVYEQALRLAKEDDRSLSSWAGRALAHKVGRVPSSPIIVLPDEPTEKRTGESSIQRILRESKESDDG